MNKNKPEAYKSELIESLISEISPEEQRATDRKMMLAARIFDAMKAKGMKKGQLALLLNKRPSEVTKWLSGTHNFTAETLWEISDALGVELINLGNRTKEKVVYVAYASLSQPSSHSDFNELMKKGIVAVSGKKKVVHVNKYS